MDKNYPQRFGTVEKRHAGLRKKRRGEWMKYYEELTQIPSHAGSNQRSHALPVDSKIDKIYTSYFVNITMFQSPAHLELTIINQPLTDERQKKREQEMSGFFDREIMDLLKWREKRTEAVWYVPYTQLLEFKQKYGHVKVSSLQVCEYTAKVPSFERLVAWVAQQRSSLAEYRQLSQTEADRKKLEKKKSRFRFLPSRIDWKKLEVLRMVWATHKEEWEKNRKLIQRYRKESGHSTCPDRFIMVGLRVGKWCQKEREEYNSSKLGKRSSMTRE